jgi:hypothetical protein
MIEVDLKNTPNLWLALCLDQIEHGAYLYRIYSIYKFQKLTDISYLVISQHDSFSMNLLGLLGVRLTVRIYVKFAHTSLFLSSSICLALLVKSKRDPCHGRDGGDCD